MNKAHNTMSPETQRIAIAEACGWKLIIDNPDYEPYWESHDGRMIGVNSANPLPDYLNDLNACHEFEIWLLKNHPDLRAVYRRILIECVGSDGLYWMATAAQRCEAFLKTIGKWEE